MGSVGSCSAPSEGEQFRGSSAKPDCHILMLILYYTLPCYTTVNHTINHYTLLPYTILNLCGLFRPRNFAEAQQGQESSPHQRRSREQGQRLEHLRPLLQLSLCRILAFSTNMYIHTYTHVYICVYVCMHLSVFFMGWGSGFPPAPRPSPLGLFPVG